mmetsp:Transcript_49647/g.120390  ORF Transcript_49647/g.120390 Transcript_49647/m.120390 type:complete len:91 (-) Transcript_49647:40-312(-)
MRRHAVVLPGTNEQPWIDLQDDRRRRPVPTLFQQPTVDDDVPPRGTGGAYDQTMGRTVLERYELHLERPAGDLSSRCMNGNTEAHTNNVL